MSYFLWGAPADEELLAAAKTGKLRANSGLSKQVDRLLSSHKNELAMNDFFRQWLELDRLDIVALPQELKKGQFNESVREEPLKFFNFVIDKNLPVENLIDSKYAVVDQTMADYYGLEGDFQGFTPIELPEGSPRGGVLTQAAFLMMGTSGPRTSPTIRGTVIRSKFLYDPAPPPPPNVPQLETKDDGTPRTVRELVDMHKEVSQCKSCHEKIDPVGYGLESFDYLAKHRDELKILQKSGRKLKVVKTAELIEDGYLNDRSSFNDLKSFKQALLAEKDQLARSIFENMLSYGIGRKIEFVDKPEIDMILSRLKRKNYPMKSMIAEVINSKIFRTK